jgi:hypothetical protein
VTQGLSTPCTQLMSHSTCCRVHVYLVGLHVFLPPGCSFQASRAATQCCYTYMLGLLAASPSHFLHVVAQSRCEQPP